MAADDRLERAMSDRLHAWLDPAAGPHPRWDSSPAAMAVATDAAGGLPSRRLPRLGLLLAAAVALVLLAAGLALVGGRTETHPPSLTPDGGLVTLPSAQAPTTPSTRPAPSDDARRPSPSPATSAPTCMTEWSHRGTASPKGLIDGIRTTEFNGWEGHVFMAFMHPIDSVAQISIVPIEPPFVTDHGKTVRVAGSAFYRLTLQGLTRQTGSPTDMVAGAVVPHFTRTVEPPIMEMRRIRTPRERLPISGPKGDSTEVWIVGLDQPSCLRVETLSDPGYSEGGTGDNVVIVAFDPAPN